VGTPRCGEKPPYAGSAFKTLAHDAATIVTRLNRSDIE
jgi:hypothetical protein